MGACGSRPKTLEGDTPVELPAKAEAVAAVPMAAPETTVQTSENKEGKAGEKEEEPLVDISEPEEEKQRSEGAAPEPKVEENNVAPQETKGEQAEEAAAEQVTMKTEGEAATEGKVAEEKKTVEVEQTQA